MMNKFIVPPLSKEIKNYSRSFPIFSPLQNTMEWDIMEKTLKRFLKFETFFEKNLFSL